MKVEISFDIENRERLKEILLALKECGLDVVVVDVKDLQNETKAKQIC